MNLQHKELLNIIRDLRKADTGAWLAATPIGKKQSLVKCGELKGPEKAAHERLQIIQCLDRLYRAAGL